jgi:type IV secretory pathway VirB6-like protein
VFTITTIREKATSMGRVIEVVQRQPGWVSRMAASAGLIVCVLIALAILIPVAIVIAVVFLAGMLFNSIRRLFTRTTAPNGLLDGRRNVRVVKNEP